MPGFLDSWGRPVGSPPPFFSGSTVMDGFGGMGGWGSPYGDGTGIGVFGGGPQPNGTMSLGGTGTTPVGTGAGTVASVLGRSTPKLGLNMDTANLALTGLSTIGNLWAAFQAQKLAKEQFRYTKGVTDTNLANQIATYNTGLTDRANNRAIVEGRTADQTKAYIDANSLRRYGG